MTTSKYKNGVLSVMSDMQNLYEAKDKEYGDSYIKVGKIMDLLFPDGIELGCADDFTRFHLFEWTIGKIVRSATQFKSGGHLDSSFDASVYLAMLHSLEKLVNEEVAEEENNQ